MRAIVMLLIWVCCAASSAGEERPLLDGYTRAFAAQQLQRSQLVDAWSQDRPALAQAVIATLRDPGADDERREHAARIAGLHRLVDTVDLLLPRVFVVSVLPLTETSIEGTYPFLGALIAICGPSATRLTLSLRGGEDEQQCLLVAYALSRLDGPVIADFRLERAIEDAQAKPEVQKTLKAIRAKLKTMQ